MNNGWVDYYKEKIVKDVQKEVELYCHKRDLRSCKVMNTSVNGNNKCQVSVAKQSSSPPGSDLWNSRDPPVSEKEKDIVFHY